MIHELNRQKEFAGKSRRQSGQPLDIQLNKAKFINVPLVEGVSAQAPTESGASTMRGGNVDYVKQAQRE